nr:hypothetical protein [Tanacetum cinerariifolium]
MAEVQLSTEHNILANEQQHSEQSESVYDTYLLEKVDRNTTPESKDMSHRGGEIEQNADAKKCHVLCPLPDPSFDNMTTEFSNQFLESNQGLPIHVFNILNQTRIGKEIWDNVELLMKGSGKSLQQKKEELFNEYERFRTIINESIHDYFVCFYKLINDMKITQLDIHAHQMNTKFVNNLPPYWENIVDSLAYLASTTYHLMPTQPTNPPPSTSSLTLPPQPAAQSSNDAMLATMNQIVNLLSGFPKQFPPTNNQLRTSSNSRSHATMHNGQIVTETVQRKDPGNVGNPGTRGTQIYGQVSDNKGKLVICYNCRGEGHVSRQCKEKKIVKDSQAEAFLADVECTAPYDQPLVITTTNIFEVSHEDAYDSDVDEGPHASAAFMANLSSTSGTNGATISYVNEVHTYDNQIFDNVNHLLAHEMHQEEHLDSYVESDIDDNTIPYHQYQLDTKVQDVPTEVSSVSPALGSSNPWYAKHAKIAQPTLYDGHALLKPTNTHVRVHDSEESLVQAEVYWLPAEELATQKSNPPKPVTPFVHTHPAPSKVRTQLLKLKDYFPAFETIIKRRTTPTFHEQGEWRFVHTKKAFTEQVIPFYEHVKELVQSLYENLVKEVTEFMRIFDELDKEDRPLSEELSSNCVRENSKVIKLEAEILKQQQMLGKSDKRCSFIQKNHIDLQIKFRNYKECHKNQTIGDNSHSPAVNAVFKINQLKKQLQGKDNTIRKLQTQINSMSMLNEEPTVCSFDKQALETELTQLKDAITLVRIQNDGFKVENVNLKRRYQELSTSNSYSRDTLTRKLTALTAENAKLKSELLSKMHSEPIVPKKPKVLAPGMYAISSKYSVPPQRVNRAEPTPLPKKMQATF